MENFVKYQKNKAQEIINFEQTIWYLYKSQNFQYVSGNEVDYHDENASAAHNTFNLRYSIPRKISIIKHNISNYDLYLMINQLPKSLILVIQIV